MYFVGHSSRLSKFLKESHDKSAPPDGLVHVEYEIELVHIMELNEVKQTMTVLVYVEEKWRDSTLSWIPLDFGNITQTWLPEDDIWLPDILIFNMITHNNLLHSVRAPALIKSDGLVVYSHPALYTIMCEIDVGDFPLDTQHCALEVASWEYGVDKLVLDVVTSHMLDHYKENEEWELLHVNTTTTEYHHEDFVVSELYYNIHIGRKPFFYVISLILPSMIICTICIVGLFAPFSSTGEREEKFTLGVTAILTMAVLSLMVSEKVPHSSNTVPLLVGYFMFEMIVIMVATGVTGVVLVIHRLDAKGHPPPPFIIRKLFRIGQWDKSLIKRRRRETERENNEAGVGGTSLNDDQQQQQATRPNHSTAAADANDMGGGRNSISPLNNSSNHDQSLQQETSSDTNNESRQRVRVLLERTVKILESIERELKTQLNKNAAGPTHRLPTENDLLWVQLAARLDHVFMAFFMFLLITPALYVFIAGMA